MSKQTIDTAEVLRFETYRDRGVATCVVCGGKYRPAGGPCIHEHPAGAAGSMVLSPGATRRAAQVQRAMALPAHYASRCGVCREVWRPGHTCIPQPTEKEVRELWEQGYWTHVMEDILDKLDYGPAVAAPESWEAV